MNAFLISIFLILFTFLFSIECEISSSLQHISASQIFRNLKNKTAYSLYGVSKIPGIETEIDVKKFKDLDFKQGYETKFQGKTCRAMPKFDTLDILGKTKDAETCAKLCHLKQYEMKHIDVDQRQNIQTNLFQFQDFYEQLSLHPQMDISLYKKAIPQLEGCNRFVQDNETYLCYRCLAFTGFKRKTTSNVYVINDNVLIKPINKTQIFALNQIQTVSIKSSESGFQPIYIIFLVIIVLILLSFFIFWCLYRNIFRKVIFEPLSMISHSHYSYRASKPILCARHLRGKVKDKKSKLFKFNYKNDKEQSVPIQTQEESMSNVTNYSNLRISFYIFCIKIGECDCFKEQEELKTSLIHEQQPILEPKREKSLTLGSLRHSRFSRSMSTKDRIKKHMSPSKRRGILFEQNIPADEEYEYEFSPLTVKKQQKFQDEIFFKCRQKLKKNHNVYARLTENCRKYQELEYKDSALLVVGLRKGRIEQAISIDKISNDARIEFFYKNGNNYEKIGECDFQKKIYIGSFDVEKSQRYFY